MAPFFILTALYATFLAASQDYHATAAAGVYRLGPHGAANIWDFLLRLSAPLTTPGEHTVGWAPRLVAAGFLGGGIAALALRRWALGFAFGWTIVALIPYAFFPAGTEARYLYLAAAPFTLFWVIAAAPLLDRAVASARPVPWRLIAAAGVLVLCLRLAVETRERQWWLRAQASAFEQLVTEVPSLCGAVPAGGVIQVVGGPAFDLFGENTRMALNLRYPEVTVRRVGDHQPPIPRDGVATTCTAAFVDGHYRIAR